MLLPKEEVIKAVERKGPCNIPMLMAFYLYAHPFPNELDRVKYLKDTYLDDIAMILPVMPAYRYTPKFPGYQWPDFGTDGAAIDSRSLLDDWSNLDKFIEQFPDPYDFMIFDEKRNNLLENDQRYRLGHFAYLYFERLWSFRGMENALVDMYTNPDEVHRLFRALTDMYKKYAKRLKNEMNCDGFFITDDLGTQTDLFFSPEFFRKFFAPYFEEVIDECHQLGMHFWFHTCGNVTSIMDDLVGMGVDVIHPIQKYAMSEVEIARKYAGKISFLAGFDLQQVLTYGTRDEIMREIRFMIDTYNRDYGGYIMSMGNVPTGDTPLDNIEALFKGFREITGR